MCRRCSIPDPIDWENDYRQVYCPSCWALPQREALYNYINDSQTERDRLEREWQVAAKPKEAK